jgi:hypothetical protein
MHAVLGDFVVDCVQNSIEAGAKLIKVDVRQEGERIKISIEDDGCGMSRDEQERALDPFFTNGKKHIHRRVGLGLPFLKQAVDLAGGEFSLVSEKGRGTVLSFGFDLGGMDSPPQGRLAEAFLQALLFGGEHELTIHRRLCRGGREDEYRISRGELREALGDLDRAESLKLAGEFLANQEDSLEA